MSFLCSLLYLIPMCSRVLPAQLPTVSVSIVNSKITNTFFHWILEKKKKNFLFAVNSQRKSFIHRVKHINKFLLHEIYFILWINLYLFASMTLCLKNIKMKDILLCLLNVNLCLSLNKLCTCRSRNHPTQRIYS